jgi:hypothetical protein
VDWKLWFIKLSGWPAFLTIVGVVFAGMLALSVGLTRISHRSVMQNALLAVAVLAALAAGMLSLMALLTRL